MRYNHCSKHDTAIKNVGCVVTPQTKLKIGVGDSAIVAHLGTRTALECQSRNFANEFPLCPLFSLFDSTNRGHQREPADWGPKKGRLTCASCQLPDHVPPSGQWQVISPAAGSSLQLFTHIQKQPCDLPLRATCRGPGGASSLRSGAQFCSPLPQASRVRLL